MVPLEDFHPGPVTCLSYRKKKTPKRMESLERIYAISKHPDYSISIKLSLMEEKLSSTKPKSFSL